MLRPTFMGFDIAKRGIMTSQKGLDITGQNLTNWDSAGYTRQRVEQTAVAHNAGATRYGTNKVGLAGQGVDITGIGQTRDKFLDKRFRLETSEMNYYQQVDSILGDLESSIGEYQPLTDSGIRNALSSMFDALQVLVRDDSSEISANNLLSTFKNMVQTIQQLDNKLDRVQEQQEFDLEIAVNDFNQILQDLGGVNKAIVDELGASIGNPHYGPNELLDERNLLLDKLSEYGEIEVSTNADGSVKVTMNEHVVLDGNKYDKMEMLKNLNGTVKLNWVSTGSTAETTNGVLKGYTDFINGRGPNLGEPGETSKRGILYYKDQLDIFASTLTDVVNHSIPEEFEYETDAKGNTIVDANGDPVIKKDANGKEIVKKYKTLLGSMSDVPDKNGKYVVKDDGLTNAANISISDEWNENSNYVIFKNGSLNNRYAQYLMNSLQNEEITFQGRGESFTGTFTEFVDNYSTTLASDRAYYTNSATSTANIAAEMQDRRDSVAGVVVDEEVANVMLYQKSLQAASRLMTALDEALDVIVNKMGIVGR